MYPDPGRPPVGPPPGWPTGPSWPPPAPVPTAPPRHTPRAALVVAVAVTVVALLVLAGVGGYLVGRSEPAILSAPLPVSPAEGQSFDFYPRVTPVSWDRVEGARSYAVDVQYFNSGDNTFYDAPGEAGTVDAAAATYTFSFVGAQEGRWRVTAIGADGVSGPPSAWRTFVYQR